MPTNAILKARSRRERPDAGFRNRITPTARAGGLYTVFADEIDNALLQRSDQRPNPNAGSLDVDQCIDHELPGTVIRDLPTAIDLDDRNITRRE